MPKNNKRLVKTEIFSDAADLQFEVRAYGLEDDDSGGKTIVFSTPVQFVCDHCKMDAIAAGVAGEIIRTEVDPFDEEDTTGENDYFDLFIGRLKYHYDKAKKAMEEMEAMEEMNEKPLKLVKNKDKRLLN